jgi:hypothetical protein
MADSRRFPADRSALTRRQIARSGKSAKSPGNFLAQICFGQNGRIR